MAPVPQPAVTEHGAGYLLPSARICDVEGVTLADDTGLLLMQWSYGKLLTLSRFRLFLPNSTQVHTASVEAYGS